MSEQALPGTVRLQSDGTPSGTRVLVLQADGNWQPLRGVGRVSFHIKAGEGQVATIAMSRVQADLVGQCEDVGQ